MAPRWCWLLLLALVLETAVAQDTVTLTASATTATVGQTVTLTAQTSEGLVNCTFYVQVPQSSPAPLQDCIDLAVSGSNNVTTCEITETQPGVYSYVVSCSDGERRKRAHAVLQPGVIQAAKGKQAVKPLFFATSDPVTVTWVEATAGDIAKILLSPDFVEAHCDEVVRLVATALDASDKPVANATICFFISGQPQLQHYHPELKRICHVTDALGSVALTFTSKLPGPLAVVAAGRNSEGMPVVSRASHVMFWGHDEHEEHHHHGERKGWWRNTEYSAAAIKQAIDGMAAAPAVKALMP